MVARPHQLSIVEAVETLSNIADLEYDQEMGVVQKHEISLLKERIPYKTVNWFHQADGAAIINGVREIFRSILYYLQDFYKGEYHLLSNQNSVESIKAIMVLVEEAAKKLDKYGKILFSDHKNFTSVSEFKEFKQLKEFFLTKIARKRDEGNLSKWILNLSQKKESNLNLSLLNTIPSIQLPTNFKENNWLFVNLEAVKIDSEYELLYIRRQDGSRFFNPRLLRNIKLVCDLEYYFNSHGKLDPLTPIAYWYDHIAHGSAKQIMKGLGSQLDFFLKELRTNKSNELIDALNKTIMALMFSSQSRNLLHHQPIKSCAGYFEDFLIFLRKVLESPTYQKWLSHPPKKNNNFAWDLIHFIENICRCIYTNTLGWEEIPELIDHLLIEAKRLTEKDGGIEPAGDQVWEKITYNYNAFSNLLKRHPNGPLLKLIRSLEISNLNKFDPLHQQNIPQQLFDLYFQEKRISLIRMPNPTYQQIIHKAIVNEEFKAFIRSYSLFTPAKKHLIINFQNRTSWIEFARCTILEELQFQADFMNQLCVVTLPVHTDFYVQLAHYHDLDDTEEFLNCFDQQLIDTHSGFYFPPIISNYLKQFSSDAFKAIQKVFFGNQKTLKRNERLDFIEIFYLLMQIKLLEWTNAQTFSLTCKDGVDIGSTHVSFFFQFFKLINQQQVENEWKFLNMMLFMPAILLRERNVLAEPFNRMILILQHIEKIIQELGREGFDRLVEQELGPLFDSTILHATLALPHIKTHLAQNFEKGIG